MKNQFIISPFFLQNNMQELAGLLQPDWILNKAKLTETGMQQRMAKIYRPLANHVSDTIYRDQRPVIISGDCCHAIGVVAGLQ